MSSKNAGMALALVLSVGMCAYGQGASSAPGAAPTAAAKHAAQWKQVIETYGKQMVKVRSTADDQDDLDLGRQMMAAAGDEANSKAMRFVLALAAVQVAIAVGSDDGADLSRRAIELADYLGPLEPIEKAGFLRRLCLRQYNRARAEHRNDDELAELGKTSVQASMDYTRMAITQEACAGEAAASLREARILVGTYHLDDLQSELDDLDEDFHAISARRTRLKEGLSLLEVSRKKNDRTAINAASKSLAQTYLECDGDIRSAAKYLAPTDDPRAKTLSTVAAFLDDPKSFVPESAPSCIEALAELTRKLSDNARVTVAKAGLAMAQAYLATNPPSPTKSRIQLLAGQLDVQASMPSPEALRRKLASAYGSCGAKIEVIDKDRVRLTYDFSNPKQLSDWQTDENKCQVGKGVLACKTGYDDARILSKIRLRFDRPWKVSISGASPYSLGAGVLTMPWSATDSSDYHYGDGLRVDKSGVSDRYGGHTLNDTVKLQPGKAVKIDISMDAKQVITWKVRGVVVRQGKARDTYGRSEGCFQLELRAQSDYKRLAMFDTVVIEGDVMPDPSWNPKPKRPVAASTSGPS